MTGFTWFMLAVAVFGALAYRRASLLLWTGSTALLLALATKLHGGLSVGITISWIIFFAIYIPLNIKYLRRRYISKPLFNFYKTVMPTMSRTEREAIHAGTVTWEGDLFRGNPDWNKLLALPTSTLSMEEQAFIDGSVDTLCRMINDWDITHNRADLPPEMWKFIKEQGFFGLIIPKQYGGKEFSAYAHSQILTKISSCSITVSTTVAVPNSLGPAELLLHYGTEEQKNYYLPKLARGEEIPCFALTSPTAGSDAGAMTDYGIVCRGDYKGEQVLGIKLNFDKRYITLAPVATVIGLAFKLYDPDHLLGNKTDIGITCALIPRHTAGISIGRRHYPLNTPFQNGPIHGNDVFIPMDYIIGGALQVGKGWRMLMECLAVGRAISLPSSAMGGSKIMCYATGAYARIRKQFNVSIGRFEGIEEPLARSVTYAYIMDAARTFAVSAVDAGEKPSVASAIVKYHATEFGRKISIDAMDIFGGKGICLGPNNFIGRGYQSIPIAITVEGANILTRNMIIFGQGVIRCHPYVLAELEAAKIAEPKAALAAFDTAVIKHVAFGISNVVRSFILAITGSRIVSAPEGSLKRYFQHATRFSSALALISDVSMMVMGGSLKRKESISARLGDIISYLYLMSAVLKHYYDQGKQTDDLPIVRYACQYCLNHIQDSFAEILRNYPNRAIGWVLRALIFPLGMHFPKPAIRLNHKISQLMMEPSATRDRLSAGAYLTQVKGNVMTNVQDALLKTIAAEPIEKKIKAAAKEGLLSGYTSQQQAQSALDKNIISLEEFDMYTQAEAACKKVIAVDDFTSDELERVVKEESIVNLYEKVATHTR